MCIFSQTLQTLLLRLLDPLPASLLTLRRPFPSWGPFLTRRVWQPRPLVAASVTAAAPNKRQRSPRRPLGALDASLALTPEALLPLNPQAQRDALFYNMTNSASTASALVGIFGLVRHPIIHGCLIAINE